MAVGIESGRTAGAVVGDGSAGAVEASSASHSLQVVGRRWWLVLAIALACAAVSLALSLVAAKQYDASATLLFRNPGLDRALFGSSVFSPSIDPTRESSTNISLVKSSEVAERVKRALRLQLSTTALLSKVDVSAKENADAVDVTGTDTSPRMAAAIANGFAAQYVAFRQQADRQKVADAERLLRARLASRESATKPGERQQLEQALQKLVALQAVQTGNAEVVSRARVPVVVARPKPKQNVAIALIVGLALGLGVAFLVDLLDRRVRSAEEFEQLYGVGAIVSIPQRSFEAQGNPEEETAKYEPYRMVHNGLALMSARSRVRVVLVTSAMPSEGKTSVALNLGRVAALAGDRAVVVEADLRRPSVARARGIAERSPGLTSALVGGQSAHKLLAEVSDGVKEFQVLPSGPLPPNPAELLRTGRMGTVLEELAADHDLVIIDAPPLIPVADPQILMRLPQVDACLLVARVDQTTRREVTRARAILNQQAAMPFGLVVTGTKEPASYTYYA